MTFFPLKRRLLLLDIKEAGGASPSKWTKGSTMPAHWSWRASMRSAPLHRLRLPRGEHHGVLQDRPEQASLGGHRPDRRGDHDRAGRCLLQMMETPSTLGQSSGKRLRTEGTFDIQRLPLLLPLQGDMLFCYARGYVSTSYHRKV